MPRFIVVSYDQSEQQTFFDPVEAEDFDDAIELAGEVRGDYAFICDVLDKDDIIKMASCLDDFMSRAKDFYITYGNARRICRKYKTA